jgi:hypothetical protein
MTTAMKSAAKPASKKAAATKKPATKRTVKPVGTPEKPLASGWVRQSLAPVGDGGVSKWTTQAQRRILRAIVRGEFEGNRSTLPAATGRTIDRLSTLGYVAVRKDGAIRATPEGTRFVEASPVPRERTPKAETKPAAKKAPAKGTKKAPAKKPAAKAATGTKRVVRRSASKGA